MRGFTQWILTLREESSDLVPHAYGTALVTPRFYRIEFGARQAVSPGMVSEGEVTRTFHRRRQNSDTRKYPKYGIRLLIKFK